MADDLVLKVTLTGDGRQLKGTLTDAQGQVRKFSDTTETENRRAQSNFSKTRKGVQSISTQLGQARAALLAFLGVGQLTEMARNMTQTAAAYQDARTRLEALSGSSIAYAVNEQYLIELAEDHHKNFLTLGDSYSRLLTLQNSGLLTQENSRDILEGLSNAASELGASSTQLEQAMYGLSQGLSAGVLRAEEFNQVMEPLPGLMQQLDQAAGLGAGGFRKLVNEGSVTSAFFRDTLITALESYEGAAARTGKNLNAQYADIGNSYLMLARALEAPLTDMMTPALTGIGNAMDYMTDHADTLVPLVESLAEALFIGGAAFLAYQLAAHRATIATLTLNAAMKANVLIALGSAALGLALAFKDWGDEAEATARRLATATSATDDLRTSVGYLSAAQVEQQKVAVEASRATAQAAVDAQRAAVAELQAKLDNPGGGRMRRGWAKNFDEEQAALDSLTAELAEYDDQLALLDGRMAELADGGSAAGDALAEGLGQGVDEVQKLLDDLLAQWHELTQSDAEQLAGRVRAAGGGEADVADAEALRQMIATERDHQAALQATADAQQKVRDTLVQLQADYLALNQTEHERLAAQLRAQGASDAQIRQAIDLSRAMSDQQAALDASAAAAADYDAWLQQVRDDLADYQAQLDPLADYQARLAEETERLHEAVAEGDLEQTEMDAVLERWQQGLDELAGHPALEKLAAGLDSFAGGVLDTADAMRGMYEQGSTEYQQLTVLIQAMQVAQGVAAVLNQLAAGDPYTAIPRAAAVAASIAALGVSIAQLQGGFEDDSQGRQETQGTGTVLGDAAAKSESIANAVEITADATRELVGINRDMLRALQSVQQGISGASNLIVRDAQAGINFDHGLDIKTNLFDNPLGNAVGDVLGAYTFGLGGKLFDAIGSWLGGSSKVTDQGIILNGGQLGDLRDDVDGSLYQDVKYKTWKFGETHRSRDTQGLDGAVEDQFALVFDAIANSVYAGATALGLSGDSVADSINEFVIKTQQISLKGLSADEQRAEIEAVFSRTFDQLAGSVVPFLKEMQQAGEGLGETLARVATNVQVTEQAVERLGIQAQNTGVEQFAQLSTALVEAAGGVEQFIAGMNGFIEAFAPEQHRLDLMATDLQRALGGVGLSLPATRDELWALMQSLDASTSAGRAQIATLLELTGLADAYYSQLEDQGKVMEQVLGSADGAALREYFADLSDFVSAESAAIEQSYNERIQLLQEQGRIARELRDYTAQLRLSDLSPAEPAEKLDQASARFAELLVKAEAGDLDAARELQAAADTYLQNADAYYGRSDAYGAIFDDVVNALDQLGLDLEAGSSEAVLAELNEQMLAEQQALRDLIGQELDWAVASYDQLSTVAELLNALPADLAGSLQALLAEPETDTAPEVPDRPDGSHRTGLARVPFDGYVAELHQNERVLTEREARQYDSGVSQAVVAELERLRAEVAALRSEQRQAHRTAEGQRSDHSRSLDAVARHSRPPVEVL